MIPYELTTFGVWREGKPVLRAGPASSELLGCDLEIFFFPFASWWLSHLGTLLRVLSPWVLVAVATGAESEVWVGVRVVVANAILTASPPRL